MGGEIHRFMISWHIIKVIYNVQVQLWWCCRCRHDTDSRHVSVAAGV